jgi:ribonucleoside-diphosphate reductase alpha chain
MAWKKGVKSLYYCRSLSIQRADAISEKVVGQSDVMAKHVEVAQPSLNLAMPAAAANSTNYEECLACQ